MKVTKEDRRQLKRVLKDLGRKKTKKTVFYDLCFCLCAPQTTFKSNMKVIKELKKRKFYTYDVISLPQMLKPVRFYNNKARYLLRAKKEFDTIYDIVKEKRYSVYEKREILVKGVKGLGMKAASHFLRNLGDEECAIIDTHIIKFMAEKYYGVDKVGNYYSTTECIENFKNMATRKDGYLILEKMFQNLTENYRLSAAELDLLIWVKYSKTPWEKVKY